MAEMNQAIEATGTNVENAIEAGLTRLGVGRDAVEIEVLDDGSRGLFGLGAREARVRLTPKVEAAPQPALTLPAERVISSGAEPAPSPAPPLTVEPAEEPALGGPAEPPSEALATASPKGKDEAEAAHEVLQELLTLMGIERVQVSVRRDEPAAGETGTPLVLDVQGPGADILIGRRGETMAALQHVTRLIVGREVGGRTDLVVDVDGFKARRKQSLLRLAQRMAEQAKRTHRTVMLEPMPPHERRIIHMALRDHPDVTTESVGEQDRRKVTIIPR